MAFTETSNEFVHVLAGVCNQGIDEALETIVNHNVGVAFDRYRLVIILATTK